VTGIFVGAPARATFWAEPNVGAHFGGWKNGEAQPVVEVAARQQHEHERQHEHEQQHEHEHDQQHEHEQQQHEQQEQHAMKKDE
jgi:hypothetical protein